MFLFYVNKSIAECKINLVGWCWPWSSSSSNLVQRQALLRNLNYSTTFSDIFVMCQLCVHFFTCFLSQQKFLYTLGIYASASLSENVFYCITAVNFPWLFLTSNAQNMPFQPTVVINFYSIEPLDTPVGLCFSCLHFICIYCLYNLV